MNDRTLELISKSGAPVGPIAFELDEDALLPFLEATVDQYGPCLQDLDVYDDGIASAGVAQLVEDAREAGVIRAPVGVSPDAIQISPVAGYGVFGLVMVELGRAGLNISRWPLPFSESGLSGQRPLEDFRKCLEEVVDEANLLLRLVRTPRPAGR